MSQPNDLKKLKLTRWKLRKEMLGIVLLSLFAGGGSYRKPTLPLLVETVIEYFKEEKKYSIEEKRIKKALEEFEKKEIIAFQEKDNQIYVTINDQNPLVIRYNIQSLIEFKINKKEFNGKWYLVFFDVPEIQRNKRNQLRRFLERLGFYRYQKSVYIFPYSCEEEIKLIKQIVEGAKYMKYIIADRIEEEEKVKAHFQLI